MLHTRRKKNDFEPGDRVAAKALANRSHLAISLLLILPFRP
jgi:hypothetical protein